MKYKTLTFDANKPIVQAITTPLNSKYGIAVKVQRDSKDIACSKEDIKVDGLSAVSQIAGYNLYELSSDGGAGSVNKDIVVDVPDSFDLNITLSGIGTGVMPVGPTPLTIDVYLSSYISEPITVKREDFSVRCSVITAGSGVPKVETVTTTNLTLNWDGQLAYVTEGYNKLRYKMPDSFDIVEVDELTLPAYTKISKTFSGPNKGQSQTVNGVINLRSNDSLKTKFVLQVNKHDLGYIDN